MDANAERRPPWPKVVAGFLLIFVVYQAAEGLQTVIAPGNPIGPVLMLLSLLMAWPVGRWLGGRGYDKFGLALTRRWWAVLMGGMLIAALAKLGSLAIGSATGFYAGAMTASPVTATAVAMAVLGTFIPSVAEDILTRGFLLNVVSVRLNLWSFAFLSALLYTANHIWRLDWGMSEQIRLFCLGLAYGAAAWRWRSLWGAVALHWGWNLANVLTDVAIPLNVADVVAERMISAGTHIVLVAIVLLWVPTRHEAKR